jgi:hypothetical protein
MQENNLHTTEFDMKKTAKPGYRAPIKNTPLPNNEEEQNMTQTIKYIKEEIELPLVREREESKSFFKDIKEVLSNIFSTSCKKTQKEEGELPNIPFSELRSSKSSTHNKEEMGIRTTVTPQEPIINIISPESPKSNKEEIGNYTGYNVFGSQVHESTISKKEETTNTLNQTYKPQNTKKPAINKRSLRHTTKY